MIMTNTKASTILTQIIDKYALLQNVTGHDYSDEIEASKLAISAIAEIQEEDLDTDCEGYDETANELYAIKESFKKAGFTEEQAMDILLSYIPLTVDL